jgi:hypothetical protein
MKQQSDSSATPFERFDSLLKRVISVPKSEIDKREAEYKKQRKALKADASKKTS